MAGIRLANAANDLVAKLRAAGVSAEESDMLATRLINTAIEVQKEKECHDVS